MLMGMACSPDLERRSVTFVTPPPPSSSSFSSKLTPHVRLGYEGSSRRKKSKSFCCYKASGFLVYRTVHDSNILRSFTGQTWCISLRNMNHTGYVALQSRMSLVPDFDLHLTLQAACRVLGDTSASCQERRFKMQILASNGFQQ